MSENDKGNESAPVETTSVFRADIIREMDASGGPENDAPVQGLDNLPAGAALTVLPWVTYQGNALFVFDEHDRRAAREALA